MSVPAVSVIIPTYNRGWTLKNAIDSVLNQDFTDFELIVVDDGSTDDTQNILNAYKKNFTVIKQHNQGVSAARNKALACASGTFIAFLDSDDLWLPKKLSAQIEFFKLNLNALICQTNEKWIRNGIRVNPKKKHKKVSGMIFEKCLELCLISPSAVMMKRSLFETVGIFDEKLPVCEDYDLWLRITCQYPVYLIKEPFVIKYGGHEDQLSRVSSQDKFRIYALMKIIKSNLISEAQRKTALKILKKKCIIYSKGCLKRGRKREALYYQEFIFQELGR